MTKVLSFTQTEIQGLLSSNSRLVYDPLKKIYYYLPNSSIDYNLPDECLSVISLFTGGGGLDLGLEWAGFRTTCFVENNRHCVKTIKANRPNWLHIDKHCGDVSKLTAEDILTAANMKSGNVGLVVGGAPCQPFSSLGSNAGESIPNGQLYRHFINLVKEIRPMMFLFENVRGMAQNHKKVIEFMKDEFSSINYGIEVGLLCAADYGVPQKRYRIFIIGRRDNEKPGFPFPTHAEDPKKALPYFKNLCDNNQAVFPYRRLKKWRTVEEVFSEITEHHLNRSDSFSADLSPHIIEMIRHIRPHTRDCWQDLPVDLMFNCWKKGKFQGKDNFGRLLLNEPAVTIRTGAIYPAKGRYIHPVENRGLNTIEMAALQSFPLFRRRNKRWLFQGGIMSVARQIGNAVPPLLAEALGHTLREQITEIYKKTTISNSN
ncbi:DNA cytosine methyltransferase [Anaerospora sp.]|uniref:DNA cytosine methyltransferase n=1 Tax=Anaerospora sp. TaxID=1960278 RepID=UPI00289C8E56|nr:DNA cytosine methyltransferase [Anaerospora sp.]